MANGKLILFAFCLGTAFGQEETQLFFSAKLDGAQETPPVTTQARGVVGFKLNPSSDTMMIHGAVSGLSGPITNIHIHNGRRGLAGGVLYNIQSWTQGNSIDVTWTGFTREDLSNFLQGRYYVNVHTTANPNGEIRGQIELERNRQFIAELDGAKEVPAVATPATGLGVFLVSPDDSAITVRLAFGGLKDSVTVAHLHAGPPGVAGSVIVNLTPFITLSGRAIIGRVALPKDPVAHAAFMDSLSAGSIYVNVHSKAHTGGEIRGQLNESRDRAFVADLEGAHEVPEVNTASTGLGVFVLSSNDSLMRVQTSFQGLDTVTAAHFHLGDAQVNGPVAVDLESGLSENRISDTLMLANVDDAARFVDELTKGDVYVNVHTKAHPSGEIRGQLMLPARIGATFRMDGSEEVPAVNSEAFGTGVASMDLDSTNVVFTVVADSLDSTFTAAHFHKQEIGKAGAVVFDIGSLFHMNSDSATGLSASGIWSSTRVTQPFTRALATAFLEDSLYINIHSRKHPTGEIRGQIEDFFPDEIVVRIRPQRKSPGLASRLLLGAGGMDLRIQAEPGKNLRLSLIDLQGRVKLRTPVSIGKDGYSQSVGLSSLKPGLYVAAWGDGQNRKTARFLRQ